MKDELRTRVRIDLGDGTSPIAMVDDEEIDHELVKRFHKRSGIANPLIHFLEGAAFIAHLETVKSGAAPLPALVLMDINMPRMDGFETIETMRRDEFFRRLPVVMMLTSSSDVRDRERASMAGADDYLLKSYNPKAYQDFFASLAEA